MALANVPEDKIHFDRIYALARQNAENAEDMKELYRAAKDAGIDVKRLREAIKRALMADDKKTAKRQLEDEADDLLKALGPFADTDLGRSAVEAAE